MEKKHSANEKLDAVLTVLNNASNNLINATNFDRLSVDSNLKASEIILKLIELGFKDIDSSELILILEYLIDESYVKMSERTESETMNIPPRATKFYKITFSGKVLIENGGYIQKQKTIKDERFRQTLATWMAAIGAVLAGIYGVFEMSKSLLRLLLN